MKNFGMQHKVFLSILPFFVVFALIGSGFALFIFDNQETTSSSNISITVENGYELGNIYLTSDTVTSATLDSDNVPTNQEKDISLSTTLFFDYKSLYFIRSDNITKERDFNIYYYNASEESGNFKYSNVQLNLDLSITSTVAKGKITQNESTYNYSTSAIDYIDLDSSSATTTYTVGSTDTTNDSKISSKTTYSDDNKTASATYTLKTGLTSNTNYSVNLDLLYNSVLAPNADSNSSYFSEVIAKMKEAISNSGTNIALKFYLTYNQ